MPILITLFIVSIILYIYFKVKITKSKDPLYMHITNAKARITLGIFVSTFFYESILLLSNEISSFYHHSLFNLRNRTNCLWL